MDYQHKTVWVSGPKSTVEGMCFLDGKISSCPSYGRVFVAHIGQRVCWVLGGGFAASSSYRSTFKPGRAWLGLVAKLGSVITLILKKLDLDK